MGTSYWHLLACVAIRPDLVAKTGDVAITPTEEHAEGKRQEDVDV